MGTFKRCDFARLILLYRTDKVHFLLPFRVANFLSNQTAGKNDPLDFQISFISTKERLATTQYINSPQLTWFLDALLTSCGIQQINFCIDGNQGSK